MLSITLGLVACSSFFMPLSLKCPYFFCAYCLSPHQEVCSMRAEILSCSVLYPHNLQQCLGHGCVHAQSFQSLQPMDGSLPDSSVHGILQARILEWVVVPSSRGSSLGLNPSLLCLQHWQAGSLPLVPPGHGKNLINICWLKSILPSHTSPHKKGMAILQNLEPSTLSPTDGNSVPGVSPKRFQFSDWTRRYSWDSTSSIIILKKFFSTSSAIIKKNFFHCPEHLIHMSIF